MSTAAALLLALSHLAVALGAWALAHRAQILSLAAAARELGPEFAAVLDAVRAKADPGKPA